MRIASKALAPANEVIVIPRQDGDIILEAAPIMEWDTFEKLVPEPKVPDKIIKEQRIPDYANPNYIKATEKRNNLRQAYLIIYSLKATPGLEWDTVKFNEPDTWENYLKELSSAFSMGEVAIIINGVMAANGLDNERIEEAKKRFLATPRA